MKPIRSRLAKLRQRLLPGSDDEGSEALWSLLYLGFLFVNWGGQSLEVWLTATVASIVVFVPLFIMALRQRPLLGFRFVAAIAAIGYALMAVNVAANTYLIYAAACLPYTGWPLRRSIGLIVAGLALQAIELYWVGVPMRFIPFVGAITAVIAIAVCAANHHGREKRLRQAELKLSHDEVRRLGALAERERIGRDLHDLLGHTLSLITLKSELAAKLFERDPQAARREIVEVERVARDALAQVRRAVSGIRAAGLAVELASARLLLESCSVRLDYRLGDVALPPALETVFALVVREAVTNIQRHAKATQVRVELSSEAGEAALRIEDDGRGGAIEPGNGLSGMRERLRTLGGRLDIQSTRGRGTILHAVLPLPTETFVATAVREATR